MKLINTDLSKRIQTQKGTCYDSIYLTYIESVNLYIEKEHGLVATSSWGKEKQLLNGMGLYFGVMRMFWNLIEVAVVQHC